MSLKKAAACVRKNKSFLITVHTSPEGDALGAELAFARLLEKLGKRVVIVNEDSLPYGYDFLPGIGKIRKFKRNLKGIRFDCFVALDCSDLKRAGEVYRLNTQAKLMLNIDHHISNERFAEVNWVEPDASCTCEMLYKLYKKLNVPLDREAAIALYTGILTDTGSFRYANTTSFTHRVVADLLRYGIEARKIYHSIYEDISFAEARLLARILPQMKQAAGGKVAWFKLLHNLLRRKDLSFDLGEYLLSFARSIKDVEVAVLFKENLGVKDEIRINFRSQGKVDVNKIAKVFGGGGHKTASGATIRGKIDTVRKKVLAKIKESLK